LRYSQIRLIQFGDGFWITRAILRAPSIVPHESFFLALGIVAAVRVKLGMSAPPQKGIGVRNRQAIPKYDLRDYFALGILRR
jgi:hypothetical protein